MRFVGIDPSTKTGLCILNADGEILDALEVTGEGKDPDRMIDIVNKSSLQLEMSDVVAIEGFAYGAKGTAVSLQYGIGWGLRMELCRNHIPYREISPSALKKFASGKGNTKKDELSVEIYKRWGFEHKSDNVRDAYVLAQIARALHKPVKLTAFQQDVIDAIRNPEIKPKARKRA